MELGTFLPYLKIQYRKGSENGFADFLSRYPTFKKYYVTERDKFYLAPAIFDVLQSVPLFTHDIADEEERKLLQGWSTTILESPRPAETSAFWQSTGSQEMIRRETADTNVDDLSDQINALREVVTDQDFWKEQDALLLIATLTNGCSTWTFSAPPMVGTRYCGTCTVAREATLAAHENVGCNATVSTRMQPAKHAMSST